MRTIKTLPAICAAALCAFILAPSARANQINGSIGFGASGVSVNSLTLSTATWFAVPSPFITVESGTYSGVPTSTTVAFNGFTFSGPSEVTGVTPLWSFTVGSTTYSFNATSVSSFFNAGLNQWDIGGAGTAIETGFDNTPGTWNVNLSQSGSTFVFDSSAAAAPAPDGGSTVTLLGASFIGLVTLGRKSR